MALLRPLLLLAALLAAAPGQANEVATAAAAPPSAAKLLVLDAPANDTLPVTPAPMPKTPPAIIESIAKAIFFELENTPYQWANALLAFILGLVMVFDGDFSFRWVVVCVVFVVVGIMAMNQVTATWNLSYNDPLRNFVGLEAGILGGYAALRGIDGVQIVVGAFLGAAMSHQSLVFLNGLHFISDHRWRMVALVVYFSVFVFGLAAMFSKKMHLKWLAVLSAGLGGAFCSSAIAFAVTQVAANGYMNFLQKIFPGLTPKGGTWIQFMHVLWSSSASDVGLFAGSKYNYFSNSTDRIADVLLWIIFWIIGALFQLRRQKQQTAPAKTDLKEPFLGELPK